MYFRLDIIVFKGCLGKTSKYIDNSNCAGRLLKGRNMCSDVRNQLLVEAGFNCLDAFFGPEYFGFPFFSSGVVYLSEFVRVWRRSYDSGTRLRFVLETSMKYPKTLLNLILSDEIPVSSRAFCSKPAIVCLALRESVRS